MGGEVSNNNNNCPRSCGPFELDKNDIRTISPYGLVYAPGSPFDFMRLIIFPNKSSVWIPEDLPTGYAGMCSF